MRIRLQGARYRYAPTSDERVTGVDGDGNVLEVHPREYAGQTVTVTERVPWEHEDAIGAMYMVLANDGTSFEALAEDLAP